MQSSGLYTSGLFSCMSGFCCMDAGNGVEVAWGNKKNIDFVRCFLNYFDERIRFIPICVPENKEIVNF